MELPGGGTARFAIWYLGGARGQSHEGYRFTRAFSELAEGKGRRMNTCNDHSSMYMKKIDVAQEESM